LSFYGEKGGDSSLEKGDWKSGSEKKKKKRRPSQEGRKREEALAAFQGVNGRRGGGVGNPRTGAGFRG